MATLTPKTLVEGTLLTAAATTLYTVPSSPSTTTTLRSLSICNTDILTHAVTVYLVASGGAAGLQYTLYDALPIAPGDTLIDDAVRTMMTGDFISGFADVSGLVSIRADGAELT